MAGTQITQYVNTLKGIFKGGSSNVVGLDIGLSAIKVCETSRSSSGDIKILKYASVPLPEGALIEDEIQNREVIIAAIKEAFKLAKIGTDTVAIGMSGPNTVARRLQLAGGAADEIESQVDAAAKICRSENQWRRWAGGDRSPIIRHRQFRQVILTSIHRERCHAGRQR